MLLLNECTHNVLSSSSEAINSSLDLGNAINGSGFQSGVPNAESLIAFTESANRQTSNLSQVRNSSVKKSELRGWWTRRSQFPSFKALISLPTVQVSE